MIFSLRRFIIRHERILIPLFYFLMSIISVAYLASFREIYTNSDFVFHWNRIWELHYDLTRHIFPQFATHMAIPSGIAVPAFYPWLVLLPFALLTFIIRQPVPLFYSVIGIVVLGQYISSFMSYRTIDHSKMHSWLFSLVYTNSSLLFTWMIAEGNLGAFIAAIFVPIAFFGFLNWFRKGRWLMLSAGLTLLTYSHPLTAVMMIGLMIFLILCNLTRLRQFRKWLHLFFAFLLAIFTTALYWLPLMNAIFSNGRGISLPAHSGVLSDGLINNWGTAANYCYGLVEIIGFLLILGCRKYHFRRLNLQLWIVGTISLLINVAWISAGLVKVIPGLIYLQSAFRFMMIGHLVFAYLVTRGLISKQLKNSTKRLSVAILVPILLLTPLFDEIGYQFVMHSRPLITEKCMPRLHPRNIRETQFTMDNRSFSDVKHTFDNLDYAPKPAQKNLVLFHRWQMLSFHPRQRRWGLKSFVPTVNGIMIKSRRPLTQIQLPITIYRHEKYHFLIDGRMGSKSRLNHHFTDQTRLLTIRDIPRGTHVVQIHPLLNIETQVAIGMALVGMIAYGGFGIDRTKLFTKKEEAKDKD